jgi:hypothetical protein
MNKHTPMTAEQIELELQLHIINLCLATLSKKPGVLRECVDQLVSKVCELLKDASRPAP